jgi:hypothetical protein
VAREEVEVVKLAAASLGVRATCGLLARLGTPQIGGDVLEVAFAVIGIKP